MVVFKHVEHKSEVKFWIGSSLSALWTWSRGFSITTIMLYLTFLNEGSQMFKTQNRSQILDWEPSTFIVDTEKWFHSYKHYSSFYLSVWGSQMNGRRIHSQILDLGSRWNAMVVDQTSSFRFSMLEIFCTKIFRCAEFKCEMNLEIKWFCPFYSLGFIKSSRRYISSFPYELWLVLVWFHFYLCSRYKDPSAVNDGIDPHNTVMPKRNEFEIIFNIRLWFVLHFVQL